MAYLDPTVYMMDAGEAMIEKECSFGEIFGQVKAELRSYGKLYHVSDYSGGKFADTVCESDLPKTAGECDLFIDSSTFFRRSYYAVKIESTSDGRWAVKVTEGNKNSPARSFLTLSIAAIGFIRLIMVPGLVMKLIAIALIVLGLFLCFIPSRKSIANASGIIKTLEKIN